MSRLIVVSNRVSVPKARGAAGSQGGLAVALGSALRERRGIWFGWSGNETKKFSGHLDMQKNHGVTTATIDLEPQDVDEYYNGYANRTLWPLFHYRIDLAEYESGFGKGYERVNQRFADSLGPLIDPEDVVWVHDYHLIPLGRELRALGVDNRIGFFLHIPWPARELFVTLPQHADLVWSLFGYDLVGFQTDKDLAAFRDYFHTELNAHPNEEGLIDMFGRRLLAKSYPISINPSEMVDLSQTEEASSSYRRIRKVNAGRKILLGVDRIDYSKGLLHKFAAYNRFLEEFPDRRGTATLLQIGQPSRDLVAEYQDLGEDLIAEAGRINGRFGRLDWTPLSYHTQSYGRDALAGIYRAAHACLVTPLRDGMNLVAKEYIAAQDPDDPGVLVLSRFAGAAAQMPEALLVNPYAPEEVADAIQRALKMPLAERKSRFASLREGVEHEDVHWWREKFVKMIEETETVR